MAKKNDLAELSLGELIDELRRIKEIEKEIRSDDLKKKLAVQSKQREIDSAQQEAEKHKALLYGALPREIADRMLAGDDVSGDHYDHAAVLFLDIGGYTRLCEKLGSSEVNAVIEKHFSVFMDAIHANDGDVNETAGDGLMVLFLNKDQTANAMDAVLVPLNARPRPFNSCNMKMTRSWPN